MSSPIIAIKRSQSNNAPSTLANGEIAYSFSSNKLFIGQTDTANDATVEDEPGKIVADVQSTKLKQMLAGIKSKG